MPRADDLERDFAQAVLDSGAEIPAPLVRKAGGTPKRRFGVYRNNVYASLIDVLAGRFPAVLRLVGDDFFRAMARVYVQGEPPHTPVLLRYGEGFPVFVAEFPPAASVPYLADVARLEWAWHAAYHAPDAVPLPLEAFVNTPDSAAEVTLTLHPSLSVVRSSHPVITIWELNTQEADPSPTALPAKGEDALVVRPKLEVEVRRLPEGGASFVLALKAGATLGEAAATALGEDPAFDLEANLAGLMRSGAIVGLGLGRT